MNEEQKNYACLFSPSAQFIPFIPKEEIDMQILELETAWKRYILRKPREKQMDCWRMVAKAMYLSIKGENSENFSEKPIDKN